MQNVCGKESVAESAPNEFRASDPAVGCGGFASPNWLGWALFFGALCGFFWLASNFPGSVDVRRYSSGIFDADVDRVVRSITSFQSDGLRLSVHPLFHVFVTPLSLALAHWPLSQFANAKIVCIAGILVQATLVWAIVRRECLNASAASPAAAAIFLCSFSVALFSVIPESCAWSGVSSLLPIWLSLARRGRRFSLWEAVAWAGLLPLSIGFTVTQVAFWPLALVFRLAFIWRDQGFRALWGAAARGLVSLLLGAVSVFYLARLQHSLNPSAPLFYASNLVAGERLYSRPLEIASLSPALVAPVIKQMLVYPFVPPEPGYSKVVQSYGYFSLSLEEANPDRQRWIVCMLRIAFLALFFGVLPFARRADAAASILLAGIAFQILLHLFYGREYILYSLNWVGLLVALSVISASRLPPRLFATWLVAVAVLLPCVTMWNYTMLAEVVSEVSYGLDVSLRDANGLRLTPPR